MSYNNKDIKDSTIKYKVKNSNNNNHNSFNPHSNNKTFVILANPDVDILKLISELSKDDTPTADHEVEEEEEEEASPLSGCIEGECEPITYQSCNPKPTPNPKPTANRFDTVRSTQQQSHTTSLNCHAYPFDNEQHIHNNNGYYSPINNSDSCSYNN
eukprot:342368_1